MQRLTLAAVLVAGSCHVAHAEEAAPPASPPTPHLVFSGVLGVAMPLGEAGFELEAQLTRWFGVSGGVGVSRSGPQLAMMARARVPVNDAAGVYFGVGGSLGRYEWIELVFDDAAKKTWERAYWLNGEVGVERAFYEKWRFRFFGGIGRVVNDNAYTCNDEHCMNDHVDDGKSQKYLGLSLGCAFTGI
jgi:hypothetical protein